MKTVPTMNTIDIFKLNPITKCSKISKIKSWPFRPKLNFTVHIILDPYKSIIKVIS